MIASTKPNGPNTRKTGEVTTMATNTVPKKTLAQLKGDLKRYNEQMEKEEEASKTNPQLESLKKLVLSTEAGRVDTKNITQELRKVIAEMEESPLVLEVKPKVLEYIETNSYKTFLLHPCGATRLIDAKDRAIEVMQALQELLYLAVIEDCVEEGGKDHIIKKVAGSLFWVCDYLEEVDVRERMAPEEAALCALAGENVRVFSRNAS